MRLGAGWAWVTDDWPLIQHHPSDWKPKVVPMRLLGDIEDMTKTFCDICKRERDVEDIRLPREMRFGFFEGTKRYIALCKKCTNELVDIIDDFVNE